MSECKTAEAICEIARKSSDSRRGQVIVVNALFRAQDDSDKWPISGKFNVTERAIYIARWMMRETGEQDVLAYALTVEQEIGRIVNDERNW